MRDVVAPSIARDDAAFVGRRAELAIVDITLDQSSPGAPSALVVRGEPGIGKTRLLVEAVTRATDRGNHIVWVGADTLEAHVPFGALSVGLDRAAAADATFEVAATALRNFIGGTGDESIRELSFAQICDTMTRTLLEAGEREPAAVVVDDIHLLDHESLALLGVALGRVAGHNISFVCTTRSPGRELDNQAADLLARLADWPDVEEVDLGPLGTEHVHQLLEQLLGHTVDPAVSGTVTEHSGGNPLFVLEIARSLSTRSGASEIAAAADDSDLEPPEMRQLTRHTAILQRLFPLGAESRRVAQVLAALHRIRLVDLDLVGELVEASPATVAAAFDELERRGIVISDEPGTWQLFHQFASDALYHDIGPAERRRIHRRAAEYLVTRRGLGETVDPVRLAWHVSMSADRGDVDAARLLRDAANSIKNTGPLSAAALCERALELVPDGAAERGDLLFLRTRCLILAGRPRSALETGQEALDTMPAGTDERTRTATAVVGALFDVGRTEEARELAEREVRAGTSTLMLAQRAMLIAAGGDCVQTAAAVARAIEAPARSPGEDLLACSFLAGAQLLIGDIAGGLTRLDSLRDAAERVGPNLRAYAHSRRCWSLVVSGCVGAASAAIGEADAALDNVGLGSYATGMTASRIGIDWMTGEWDGAIAAIGDVGRDLGIRDNVVIARYLRDVEVDIRTNRGELRNALSLVHQPTTGSTRSAWVAAGALRATGDDLGARLLLRSAADRPIDGTWLAHVLSRLVEIEVDAGDDGAARSAHSRLAEVCDPASDPRPWTKAIALRTIALVDRDVDAALESAAVAHQEALVHDAALSMLIAGMLHDDGEEWLLSAHESFGALGAVADRRRAAQLLRQRGAKVPRRRRRAPQDLTASEIEIARLVQAGMRNRDIAATTNYSERTVEVYLSRIYSKVGVSSRLQLARLLDEHAIELDS